MSFAKLQSLAFQEASIVPSDFLAPLRAHISGPQAGLHRYGVAAEKTGINLGSYDPAVDTAYDWPGKASVSLIDLDYTKLYIDNALLLFFSDLVGADSTVAPVSGYPGRVRSSSVVFKDHGDSDRDAALLRDVQIGDVVYVRGTAASINYELWTYVSGFKGEPIAAVTDASEAADSNHTSQTLATSIEQIAGAENCITLTAHGSAYDGLETGDIDETYTIEVISGSIGNDLTTAILRITSASGRDNVSSKSPRGAGGDTAIGTRGLTVEFDQTSSASCSSEAGEDSASALDLVPGQKWRVRVKQAFTPVTSASSGTYTGGDDTTYIVEVSKGGLFSASPEITVSTTTGVDVSGPTVVSASGSAVVVGTHAVRIAFTGASLCKGDKYYIPVTAATEGAIQTLLLGHDLPSAILGVSDLDLKLYIKKSSIQVGKNRTGHAPETNWVAGADDITVNSGILSYDSSWVDSLGDEVELPVKGGTVYVEYREWLTTYTGRIGVLSDPDLVASTLGTVHPDNPLAQAVHKALTNSNDSNVRFTAVTDPDDTDSWQEVLDFLAGEDNIYNLVPLTRNETVLSAYAAAVEDANAESSDNGLWRAALFNLAATTTKAIVADTTTSNLAVALASLADDPDTSGTQYTYMQVTSGNAELAALGVRAGDVVRYLFTTDGFGDVEYTEFVIEELINETTLRLSSGHSVAVSTPQKIEIWRTLTKVEIAADLVTRAATYKHQRVCVVWPDTVSSDNVSMEGYHLCAAIAGLRSAVSPHQGLSNVQITGFDDITRTTQFFRTSNLNSLETGGVWVVTQDTDGVVYSRHALNTDLSDLNHREEKIRANLDAAQYAIYGNLRQFIGQANVTDTTLLAIRVQTEALIELLKSSGQTQSLGGILIDGQVLDVRKHVVLLDRVVLSVSLTISSPLNKIVLSVVI